MNIPFNLPASKLPRVGTTIFTEMSALAKANGALNVSQGFPDFAPPVPLVEAVAREMCSGPAANQYAPMAGHLALREWIAWDLEQRFNAQYHPESEVTIGAGASSLIFAAIQAFVGENDEVILMEPAYDLYAPAVQLAGGNIRRVERRDEDDGLNFDALRAVLDRRTRMVIVNSPHNPTGACLRPEDLETLHQILDGSHAILLSDEVYGPIVHDGRPVISVASHPGLAQRALIAQSFGKLLHATGWKVGSLVGPAEFMAEVRKVHQYDVFSTAGPIQLGIASFLRTPNGIAHLAELAAFYETKRNRLLHGLRDTAWVFQPAQGGYFQILSYESFLDAPDGAVARSWTRSHDIGLATIPVSSFYNPRHVMQQDSRRLRVCFAKGDETLDKAIEKLRWIAEHPEDAAAAVLNQTHSHSE
ncbi:MAG: methionine aminotransferase [Flavobacteriales bacterium]